MVTMMMLDRMVRISLLRLLIIFSLILLVGVVRPPHRLDLAWTCHPYQCGKRLAGVTLYESLCFHNVHPLPVSLTNSFVLGGVTTPRVMSVYHHQDSEQGYSSLLCQLYVHHLVLPLSVFCVRQNTQNARRT